MVHKDREQRWPPVPGDFEVKDPSASVAVCTLGKKFDVPAKYAIIGTCKTENIGIERMIANVISNPSIRFFVLAGPEVPGHRTGASVRALYRNGVDPDTRRIREAEGAIPYIENVPVEAVERFRQQVELVDMLNVSDPEKIAATVDELLSRQVHPFSAEPMWVTFRASREKTKQRMVSGDVYVLPEYGVALEPDSGLVQRRQSLVMVTRHPSLVGVELRHSDEGGTLLSVREV
ncbi:MAG: tetrahydromethanopterin S-methyltransferase subunit A [Candidatus Thorarchaeota archaeon]|nr:tetrahydromethanopterin S-methyltransferase subunit A [Candidatus Thorarchaeota archaeon]